MSFCQILTPKQKALEINLDHHIYGTFAEIGAGQEVVRHFFQAGGAAGTIAKTISAYDMLVSDMIYGKSKSRRYVSEDRLLTMLDYEYKKTVSRLDEQRGLNSQFFSFADTVAAQSFSGKGECHGWMGLRFQHEPKAAPSELIIHVRMKDQENIQQQEALGIMGVNLVYAAFKHADKPESLVSSLMDGLTTRRIKIDMIRVSGDAFKGIDSRILSLELVKRKFCSAVMFDENGNVLQASDVLYKKNILVHRGSFRPPTLVNMDMLETGLNKFKANLTKEEKSNIMVLPEISMSKLLSRGQVQNDDFLARVDLLNCLGHKVLITNFDDYFSLNEYLQKYARRKISFVTGVYNLEEILDLKRYESASSGIMGALGTLFGDQTRIYVYPVNDEDGVLRDLESIRFDDSLCFLYMYLLDNGLIEDIKDYNPAYSSIWSRVVLRMIENGEKGWEKMVPANIAKTVKKKKLFKK